MQAFEFRLQGSKLRQRHSCLRSRRQQITSDSHAHAPAPLEVCWISWIIVVIPGALGRSHCTVEGSKPGALLQQGLAPAVHQREARHLGEQLRPQVRGKCSTLRDMSSEQAMSRPSFHPWQGWMASDIIVAEMEARATACQCDFLPGFDEACLTISTSQQQTCCT